MGKGRLEDLSDGVFAIVMTLIIVDIKIPQLSEKFTETDLFFKLVEQWPLVFSYFLSFAVLTMYWISRHVMFNGLVDKVNRTLLYLNMLYLLPITFIPFSASLLGTYPDRQAAIIIYCVNILVQGILLYIMQTYIISNADEERGKKLSKKARLQGKIRVILPPLFALVAIPLSFVNTGIVPPFLLLPIIFNIVPGLMDLTEKTFKKVFNYV